MTDITAWPRLAEVELEEWLPNLYDGPIAGRQLFKDEATGAEHLLIRYPEGLHGHAHTHTHAHTILVVDGVLRANGEELPQGSYVHFPAGVEMVHEPAPGHSALIVVMFHGEPDAQLV